MSTKSTPSKNFAMALKIQKKSPMYSSTGPKEAPMSDTDDHYDSIADAILSKKRKAKMMSDGGEVDLVENNETEMPSDTMLDNVAEPFGELDAIGKENYKDEDVSEQGDEAHDEHDMVSSIRKKMKGRKE